MKNYAEALNAVEVGVAQAQGIEQVKFGEAWHDGEHVQSRTGINSAMCETAALVDLLVAKGVFTLEEFTSELTKKMNAEVEIYESELTQELGVSVKLG